MLHSPIQRVAVSGNFESQLKDSRVIASPSVDRWAILFHARLHALAARCADSLAAAARSAGVSLERPRLAAVDADRIAAYVARIREAAERGAQLVVVIVKSKKSDL